MGAADHPQLASGSHNQEVPRSANFITTMMGYTILVWRTKAGDQRRSTFQYWSAAHTVMRVSDLCVSVQSITNVLISNGLQFHRWTEVVAWLCYAHAHAVAHETQHTLTDRCISRPLFCSLTCASTVSHQGVACVTTVGGCLSKGCSTRMTNLAIGWVSQSITVHRCWKKKSIM